MVGFPQISCQITIFISNHDVLKFLALKPFVLVAQSIAHLPAKPKVPGSVPARDTHKKKFTVGGFQFMVFLIPWVPNMMVWTLFFPGKNLLFKFILTGCDI